MAQVATKRKLTYEDYAAIPDDGLRHEIVDGEHHVSPAVRIRHQVVLGRLYSMLAPFVEKHDLGLVLFAPTDAVLSRHDIVQPDLLFVSTAHMQRFTETNLQGAPDLAAEILSPSNRRYDTQIKFRRYEALGVQEYWVVDPEAEAVAVYRLEGSTFQPVAVAAGEVTSPLLPGLTIRVADIFAKLPRFPR